MMFAAGFGTRMAPLTDDRPKPLIEVAGKPLIDHALDQVRAFGAERIVVNAHYKPRQLADHLEGSGVLISVEAPDILDTGGGLRAALPLLGSGPVFTMNTDAVWNGPNPLALLAAAWNPVHMDALLLCIAKDRAVGHSGKGDFLIDDAGRTTRGPGAIFTGLQVIRTDDLSDISDKVFSISLLWSRMQTTGRLYGLEYPGRWADVGTPRGIELAENMLG